MQVPPEIVLRGVEDSPYISKLMTQGIAKLERVAGNIIGTRIALERDQARRKTGNPYRMRIDITIPDRPQIVVRRSSKALKKIPDVLAEPVVEPAEKGVLEPERSQISGRRPVRRRGVREEPLPAFIRRTFDSAQRELERVVDKQRGEVKTPAQQENTAIVEKIIRDQDYGFLRTTDAQQVYFHKNSLLHRHWETLTPGTMVRYVPEVGDKGLQASTVEPIDKPGAAEMHGEIHELPEVPTRRKTARREQAA